MNIRQRKKRFKYENLREALYLTLNVKPSGWSEIRWGIQMIKTEMRKTETWKGYHRNITAPEGTFDKIFNDAKEDDDDI